MITSMDLVSKYHIIFREEHQLLSHLVYNLSGAMNNVTSVRAAH